MTRDGARQLVAEEVAAFVASRTAGNSMAAWRALERAHIVSQPYLGLHLASHWGMLRYALQERDFGEGLGQGLRLVLALLGAIFGRVPVGNTGRSNVSAFRPMPIPHDLLARMNGAS
jgi:hypothetical protein